MSHLEADRLDKDSNALVGYYKGRLKNAHPGARSSYYNKLVLQRKRKRASYPCAKVESDL